jgi:lipopolysaccharide transport system ATP-binding protein
MESFGRTGRTVLFVSHSMPTIARLCSRLLLLEQGRLVADGDTEEVIGRYLHGAHGTAAQQVWPDPSTAPGDRSARLAGARVIDSTGLTSGLVDVSEEVGIEITYEVLDPELAIVPWIDLVDEGGTLVFSAVDPDPASLDPRRPGTYVSTAWIPEHLLNEGTLHVNVSLKTPALGGKPWRHADVESALTFQVAEQAGGLTARGGFGGKMRGPVRPLLRWTTQAVAAEDAPLLARPGD